MKELKDSNEKIEVVSEQQEKKEIKLIDSQKSIPGLTLWEINLKDKTYKRAKFEPVKLEFDKVVNEDNLNIKRKVIVNEGCAYHQFLNEKSLNKKMKKLFGHEFNRASE